MCDSWYINSICNTCIKIPINSTLDTYDAVIGTGIFVPGHADEKCFDELIRIVKPGKHFLT